MKLLLTSTGLSSESIEKEFKNLLPRLATECKALVIGIDPGLHDFDMDAYIERNVQMLTKQGLLKENISNCKLDSEKPPHLDDIDLILMLGGNRYRHMYHIRKREMYDKIREFINRGGIYIGRSAGGGIMGPTVECDWGQFTNDVDLGDTSGFGFVDFVMVPHIDTMDNPEKVIEFHRKTMHKMVYITDQQAILVKGDMYKII